MRDLLTDPEFVQSLSDPDPVRRAQIQMRTPLPKRFYNDVSVGPGEGGHLVLLDGRTVRTPGKAALALPTEAAARLVADEFAAQDETINPVSMPVLRLANAAIDGVATEADAVIADIVRFSSSDLVCYRADWPDALAARQNAAWQPVLDWAHAFLGARFLLAAGVMHVEQPSESLAAVSSHLAGRAETVPRCIPPPHDVADGIGLDRLGRGRRGAGSGRRVERSPCRRGLAGRAMGHGRGSRGAAGSPQAGL